jgi:hypothetical protein
MNASASSHWPNGGMTYAPATRSLTEAHEVTRNGSAFGTFWGASAGSACVYSAALISIATCAGDLHDLDLAVALTPLDPSSERMRLLLWR